MTVPVLSADKHNAVGDADLAYQGNTTVARLTLKPREALEVDQGYHRAVKVMLARKPDGTKFVVGLQLWGHHHDGDETTFALERTEAPPRRPVSPIPPAPVVDLTPIPAGPIPPSGSPIGPRPRVLTDGLNLEPIRRRH